MTVPCNCSGSTEARGGKAQEPQDAQAAPDERPWWALGPVAVAARGCFWVVSRRVWFGDDTYPHTSSASSSSTGHFWDLPSVVLLSRTQDRLGGTVPLSNRAQSRCQGRGKKTRQAHTMFPTNHPPSSHNLQFGDFLGQASLLCC